MTISLTDLSQGSGPLYLRLADRIEFDIGEGAISEGAKLPPQRDLAFDLGVTIGTVGRAYAVLRQRGLVSGEVGRGTYVLARENSSEAAHQAPGETTIGTKKATRKASRARRPRALSAQAMTSARGQITRTLAPTYHMVLTTALRKLGSASSRR